eukprot:COSAG01_NODE_2233_length_8112_cov_41.569699_3_plen_198_part_00
MDTLLNYPAPAPQKLRHERRAVRANPHDGSRLAFSTELWAAWRANRREACPSWGWCVGGADGRCKFQALFELDGGCDPARAGFRGCTRASFGTDAPRTAYWEADDVAAMLQLSCDGDPNRTTLHRMYAHAMRQHSPDVATLAMVLQAGGDPSVKDAVGDWPEVSAADDEYTLQNFANGFHEYDEERQAMLDLAPAWR